MVLESATYNCDLDKWISFKICSVLDEYQVADRNNDPQLTDFIESEFLTEQVNLRV